MTIYETQLLGFERITLNSDETKTVHFRLKPSDMEFLNKDMHCVVEPGKFEVLIGRVRRILSRKVTRRGLS